MSVLFPPIGSRPLARNPEETNFRGRRRRLRRPDEPSEVGLVEHPRFASRSFGRALSGRSIPPQPLHEQGVLGRVETLLKGRLNRLAIVLNQRGRMEPEARKDLAAEDSVSRRMNRLKAPASVRVPVHLAVEYPPDHIFAHAVASVDLELLAQIEADAAGGHLGDEFRRPLNISIVADPDLTATLGQDDEKAVRLRFVVQIQTDAAVIPGSDSRRVRLVVTQPGDETSVRMTVPPMADVRTINGCMDDAGGSGLLLPTRRASEGSDTKPLAGASGW